MLEALGTYQCGSVNQPGLIQLEYLPTAWVNKNAYLPPLISSAWNWQRDIPIISGFSWLTVQVQGLKEKQIWNETQVRDLQGKYYRQSIVAEVPNLLPAVAKTMNETAEYRFLVRLTDKLGQPWLIGTLDDPLDFFADGTTGAAGALKHHAIRFGGETKRKAYGFKPVL